ncbi:MAG: hypothetical protein Q4C70_11330 [Planctomycetia bacterium]|nr:hypothetical protein [Planctomycetia bacterium]
MKILPILCMSLILGVTVTLITPTTLVARDKISNLKQASYNSIKSQTIPVDNVPEGTPTRADAYTWNQTHVTNDPKIPLKTFTFNTRESISSLRALHNCNLSWENGVLVAQCTGADPYFYAGGHVLDGVEFPEGYPKKIYVRVTLRSNVKCIPSFYWTTSESPNFTQDLCADSVLLKTGSDSESDMDNNSENKAESEWQVTETLIETSHPITNLRMDPVADEARVEIQKIEFLASYPVAPILETLPMESILKETANEFPYMSQTVRIRLTNPSGKPMDYGINGKNEHFEAHESRIFTYMSDATRAVDLCVWEITHPEIEPIRREMKIIHDVEITDTWSRKVGKFFDFYLSPSGEIAFLVRDNKKIAALTHSRLREMNIQISDSGILEFQPIFQSDFHRNENISVIPEIHIPGQMQYAVVPGVEILEKGEWSSSRADFIIPAHQRFRPVRHLMTQTWLGIITTDGAFRLHWRDFRFQPVFATPNYFDTTPDALMTLEFSDTSPITGKEMNAEIMKLPDNMDSKKSAEFPSFVRLEFTPNTSETAFLAAALDAQWSHTCRETVPVKNAQETGINTENSAKTLLTPEQEEDLGGNTGELFSLYRTQLETGPIQSTAGWGHCAGERWGHGPQGDIASALWRIGGNVPDFQFHRGGAHVENDTIFFIRNQAESWRQQIIGAAEHALKTRQPDGLWRYTGIYAVTHFDTTALGVGMRPILNLLRAYTVTGDEKYLTPALESLAVCRQFHVARGAQCWEMPLHTPDPLTAAYAVMTYTLAYRITGDTQFLDDARRWVLEGATYIYLWDGPKNPWQFGAYIGVLGATNWKAPNWIGRPVQWIGTVYAYALLDFADVLPADSPETTRWRALAEAITLSTERQIYPDGEFVGLLPDSIDCVLGSRYAWNINPAVPIALRLRLNGKQDALTFIWNENYRVVSPFPTRILAEKDALEIDAPKNVSFQILVNNRVIDVPAGETHHIKINK